MDEEASKPQDSESSVEPPIIHSTELGDAEPQPEGQSLGTTASRGFLWANVGVFARYASSLVLAAVLARMLIEKEYSVMVALMILTYYLDNALEMGMGAALVYEQEEGITRRVQVVFTTNMMVMAVLATATFLLAPVAASLFNLSEYTSAFRALAVVVVFSGLTVTPWALFMRAMNYRSRAIVEVLRDFTRLGVTLGLASAGYGVWAVVIGLIATYAVWMGGTWVGVHFKPALVWDTKIAKELFSYAWRMFGTRLLGVLSLNGDIPIIGNRRPDQLPMYYQAFRLPEMIMGAQLNAMSAVLFPMYARIRKEGTVAMRDALYKAMRLVGLFSIPVGIGLALIARDSLLVMFDQDGNAAIQSMEILALTGCIVGLGYATGDLLFAIGKPGIMVRLNSAMVPIMLILMWFVSSHGIVWVATVHFFTALVFTFIRQVIVNRIVEASSTEVMKSLVPSLIVSAGVVLCALPVRLITEPGFASMLVIVAAGVVGGLLGLGVSSGARHEVRDVVEKIRG